MDIFNGDEIRFENVTVAICIGDIPHTLTGRFLSELKRGSDLCEMQDDGDLITPSDLEEKQTEAKNDAIDSALEYVRTVIDGYQTVDLADIVDFQNITEREQKIVAAVLSCLINSPELNDPDKGEVLDNVKRKTKKLGNGQGYTYGEFTLKSTGRKVWSAFDDGENAVATAGTLKELKKKVDRL